MNRDVQEETDRNVREVDLSIEVTTHCNKACLYCFARAGLSNYSSLPINTVKQIIDEGYATAYRRLHITGGEPLLWEGLFETLDYAFGMGYEAVFMNTNGTLLTDYVSGKLAAHGGLSISVSLDGPEKLHDRLRGEGSYSQAVQGIGNSLDAGIGLFVFTIATKSLLSELPHFADELYKRFPDIKCLTLIPLIKVEDDASGLSKELLNPDDFLRLVRTVALLNLAGLRTNVLNDPLVNIASKLLDMPWVPQSHARYREGSMVVMANRTIGLSHSERHGFGKYKPGLIEAVLASREYQNAVSPDEATCPSCRYAELCRQNGLARPSESYMGMYPEVPYCKRVLDRVVS